MAAHALDRPGERRRRRLVPGRQQREQLVADLRVGHLRLHEHREDVFTVRVVGARVGDQRVHLPVGLRSQAQEAAPRAPRPEVLLQRPPDRRHHRAEVDQRREDALEVAQLRPLRAEDRAQDRPQRDRLEGRRRLVQRAGRPAVDLLRGDVGDQALVGLHPLAVEGRQQQLALGEVAVLVDDQQRVVAQDGTERVVVPAGVQHGRLLREDLADELRVGDRDEEAEADELERDDVAVAAPQPFERRALAGHRAEGLPRLRGAGPGRQPH